MGDALLSLDKKHDLSSSWQSCKYVSRPTALTLSVESRAGGGVGVVDGVDWCKIEQIVQHKHTQRVF